MSALTPQMAAMLLPYAVESGRKLERKAASAWRVAKPVLAVAVVGTALYFGHRAWAANRAAKLLATKPDARHAMMYAEVLQPKGWVARQLDKIGPVKAASEAVNTVIGWVTLSKSEKVNLITARILVWEDTVRYYRMFTGRSLNRDLLAQLSETEYESFSNTLGRNRNVAAGEERKQNESAYMDQQVAKVIEAIMKKAPGKVFDIGNASGVRGWKVTATRKTDYWRKPNATERVKVAAKPGDYLGAPTGRFTNHQGKVALVELATKDGLVWANLGHHGIWIPKPTKK